MGTAIRKATVDDARKLASLLRGIGWFDAFNAGSIEGSVARVSERLRECLAEQSHSVFVAEERAGEITAYGSVHWLPYLFMSGPEGYVSELFVSASARG
ncbi:MAG: hypothetical protein ACREP3_06250 [Candidatus Binatia bacterium]